jgi:hypothetical protein
MVFPVETKELVDWRKRGELIEGTRVVIIINPSTLDLATETGTVLFDETVPTGKTFKGQVSIIGELI